VLPVARETILKKNVPAGLSRDVLERTLMDSDSELLHRFAATGEEAAFARLVERHAGMMQGVAWRSTGDPAMAEEITQTVFAILARKARALRHECLAGWLHRTTFLEARNACRKARRYRKTLQLFGDRHMITPESASASRQEMVPHLDEALTCLPARERQLVVLRFYERRSVREIAAATGANEEACRKRIQRSVHRLGEILRRRGVASSTTSLAAVLAGQPLCIAPASAAAIATAALQTAPTLSASTLFHYSLQLMNTATILKTSAVVLLVAAIPITMLWQQNRDLTNEVDRLRSSARVAQLTAPGKRPGPSSASISPARSPSANPAPVDPEAAPAAPPPMAAMASFFSGDRMKKMAENEAKKRVNLAYNRICLNLPDLTDDQKTRIRAALEKKSAEETAELMKLMDSGGMAKMMDPSSLTKEERALMSKMDPRRASAVTDDATLQTILTGEQYEQYAKSQETRRVTEAENAATDTLKSVGRAIDLTPEQKDQLFNQLAQYDLAKEEISAPESPGPFPGMGSSDEKREEIIRANLTPPQLAVYDQSRAEDRQSREQMMQFLPGRASGAPSPVK
jgi:RNA polymerase sigma factor (sigma-70 family)